MMTTNRIGHVFALLALPLTLAASILAIPITETRAEPVQTPVPSTSKAPPLPASIPPACAQLDTQIRSATPLSACLDANHDAVIGTSATNTKCKAAVYVDGNIGVNTSNPQLGRINIESGGTLYVPDRTLNVKVGAILVCGKFQAGTEACPIGTLNPGNTVIFRFVGTKPNNLVPQTDTTCEVPTGFQKGLEVTAGGILQLYGARGIPLYDNLGNRDPQSGVSWTYLSQPAGPEFDQNFSLFNPNTKQYFPMFEPANNVLLGPPVKLTGVAAPVLQADIGTDSAHLGTRLHLADDVTRGSNPWRVGNWIVVGTTSFSPFETEFVKIARIDQELGGSVVTLANGLRHYHFGGPDPGLPATGVS